MDVLGVGVDVVEVARMERILERQPRFARRIFSEEEIAYCDGGGRQRAARYAARWAAREACAKSLGGIPGGRWRDMRVVRADDGSLSMALDATARDRADEVGVKEVLVSLAHERSVAIAYCVSLGEGR
jgi:holo-[acyl-carrier protein] synthase